MPLEVKAIWPRLMLEQAGLLLHVRKHSMWPRTSLLLDCIKGFYARCQAYRGCRSTRHMPLCVMSKRSEADVPQGLIFFAVSWPSSLRTIAQLQRTFGGRRSQVLIDCPGTVASWLHQRLQHVAASGQECGLHGKCLDCVADTCAVCGSQEHSKDLPRKLEGTKLTVGKLLLNLTAADRAECLFNSLRFRHFLPSNVQMRMPSGTTSNEAWHAELNSWFRQAQQLQKHVAAEAARALPWQAPSAQYGIVSRSQADAICACSGTLLGAVLMDQGCVVRMGSADPRSKVESSSLCQGSARASSVAASGLKQPAAEGTARTRTPFALARLPDIARLGVHTRKRPAGRMPT